MSADVCTTCGRSFRWALDFWEHVVKSGHRGSASS